MHWIWKYRQASIQMRQANRIIEVMVSDDTFILAEAGGLGFSLI